MKKYMRFQGKILEALYAFDGGVYYTSFKDDLPYWVALMDDGTLQILFGGVHRPTDAEYELLDADC